MNTTPTTPIPIQLAIQGGGAKICTLMAAVEAVQQLEKRGSIRVTRIAGTSAGSIVGSLYAAGYDIAALRQRVRDQRSQLQRKIPRGTSAVSAAMRLMMGNPVWSLDPLRDILEQLFRDKKVRSIGDLEKPLIVVASDLTNGETRTYKDDTDVVIHAVLDSCAMPYFFRGPSRKGGGSLLVDGGVCDNLPIEELESAVDKYGIVLGISFNPWRAGKTPENLLEFSKALLGAAMDNSVRRSQRRLGRDRLFAIDTDIDTFDFDLALSKGFDELYTVVRGEAEEFFEQFVESWTKLEKLKTEKKTLPERGWEEESATILQRHADIYAVQHRPAKMTYFEARTTVKINSFNGVPYRDHPDEVTYTLQFQPAKEPIFCHRVAIVEETGAEFLKTYRWNVRTSRGTPIKTIDLMARDSGNSNRRAYLLFFDPVLMPGAQDGPYTLNYAHQVAGLTKDLVESGRDEIGITLTRADGTVDRVMLIAYIPDEVKKVQFRACDEGCPIKGRSMNDHELVQFGIDPPLKYYAIGWIGEQIPAGTTFKAEIVRS